MHFIDYFYSSVSQVLLFLFQVAQHFKCTIQNFYSKLVDSWTNGIKLVLVILLVSQLDMSVHTVNDVFMVLLNLSRRIIRFTKYSYFIYCPYTVADCFYITLWVIYIVWQFLLSCCYSFPTLYAWISFPIQVKI